MNRIYKADVGGSKPSAPAGPRGRQRPRLTDANPEGRAFGPLRPSGGEFGVKRSGIRVFWTDVTEDVSVVTAANKVVDDIDHPGDASVADDQPIPDVEEPAPKAFPGLLPTVHEAVDDIQGVDRPRPALPVVEDHPHVDIVDLGKGYPGIGDEADLVAVTPDAVERSVPHWGGPLHDGLVLRVHSGQADAGGTDRKAAFSAPAPEFPACEGSSRECPTAWQRRRTVPGEMDLCGSSAQVRSRVLGKLGREVDHHPLVADDLHAGPARGVRRVLRDVRGRSAAPACRGRPGTSPSA